MNNFIFQVIYLSFFEQIIPNFVLQKEYETNLDFIIDIFNNDILALIDFKNDYFIVISKENWETINSIKNYLLLEQEVKNKTNNSPLKKLVYSDLAVYKKRKSL